MKILCVSDYVDPLIYNQDVKKVFPDIDMILCAGDLPMDYVDFIVTMFSKPTYFIFGNHNLKELHLYHRSFFSDHPQSIHNTSDYHGGTYIGFKCMTDYSLTYTNPKTGKRTPLLIAGVSGSKRYNKGQCQYTEKQMKFHLIKLMPKLIMNKLKYGRYLDIFLTHASPRHIHDKEDPCHIGFECFNWFIKKFKPTYLIHGHIHLYDIREKRITKVDETTVINAYAHYLLEFPEPVQD
ncbi:MAG: metallophosphoesterase [Treponema sp.]|nr:metallophosphoesterase [Treponema sp.]